MLSPPSQGLVWSRSQRDAGTDFGLAMLFGAVGCFSTLRGAFAEDAPVVPVEPRPPPRGARRRAEPR